LALSIIAILSTLAYINLDNLISSQYSSGKLINISGRQRMLSQQISLHAIYYKTKNLKKNIDLMEKNHKELLSYPMTKELKKTYFEDPIKLDEKVKKYLYHAKNFYETRSGISLTYLLKNSKSLLQDLDKATSIYVKEAEKNTNKLKKVELYIFILTLVTLFFEALFIFRPANKQIIDDKKIITQEKDYSNTVIESSTNAIITLDKELKIKTFNKMAEEIFGYKKDEMLGKTSLKKIVPKFSEKSVEELLHTLKEEKMKEVQELEGVDKKGNSFPIRISFGTSRDGEDIVIVANIQNISKEKLKDKLLQQQAKFAALGEMIAVIAHQWRQPLAQLNFNTIYIKKHLTDQKLIDELKNNEEIIQFMSETITNFEDFYKKSDNTHFNPIVSIEQVLKIVDSIIKLREIKLIKDIDSKLTIYGNSNSLAQVILSIIQNALDLIKMRKIKNPKIQIMLKDTPTHIVLTIEDNAGGIKTSPIENIFKPFISKKMIPSTGIGLYMSQLIIKEKFCGEIIAENTKNGAKFTILLPH
jgi:PAS domain S-box-containing protein